MNITLTPGGLFISQLHSWDGRASCQCKDLPLTSKLHYVLAIVVGIRTFTSPSRLWLGPRVCTATTVRHFLVPSPSTVLSSETATGHGKTRDSAHAHAHAQVLDDTEFPPAYPILSGTDLVGRIYNIILAIEEA